MFKLNMLNYRMEDLPIESPSDANQIHEILRDASDRTREEITVSKF